MRKILLALSMFAIVSGFGSAYANEMLKPDFIADGEFKVCSDPSFPPLEFFEKAGDKDPIGFDADMVRALAKHWDVRPGFFVTEFTGLLPGLEANRCDAVISGTLITPERTQKLKAVGYLATSNVVIGSSKSTLKMTSLEDLSGQVVAIQSGTNNVKIMSELNNRLAAAGKPQATVQTYPKQSDAIQQLLLGRAAASISQATEYAYRDLLNPGQLQTLYTFPEKQIFGVYIRPIEGNVKALEQALAALRRQGEMKTIAEKWKLPSVNVEQLNP
ncbi:transporter substrate-binding domain-containing protein [Pseudomonas mosselii]|uniref:transporter substrate-binding domain-containing protein n=1 Tax=Pseudomonas mosselii TaxID=78327 RepID=UPI0016488059|nr:transporter substrate-binding domain-containing protein [Pseudomonas mosselii]MBC3456959.1 transporter substrate-binding domain-containing protein [Pseudomonas mosselii]